MERLSYFIRERERVRKLKEAGKPAPWTNDPILREYRFCNVHREHDRVTRWIHTHWRKPNERDPNLWHAMVVARFINWPDTLAEIGYPEPWPKKTEVTRYALRARKARGDKVFTGAYLVSTNGAALDKGEHVALLFDRAWQARTRLSQPTKTLAEYHAELMQVNGIGSFMAAQIIADLKHTPFLKDAEDWWTWAAPGPGSTRGLNRVLGYPVRSTWRPADWLYHVRTLRSKLKEAIAPIRICLQDMQNCLCEFDKYERVLHGEGRPRSRYATHGD